MLVAASCYAPAAPDCVLSCAADVDCIAGQTCTSDHLCASTSTCGERAATDARTDGPVDAETPHPDAPGPAHVQVVVKITGGGSVAANIGAECASGTCTYSVVENTPVTLDAIDHGNNVFDHWQGMPCMAQGRTCQFTATQPVTMAPVVFDHAH